MRYPLLGPSVPSKSVEQNRRELLNMYLAPAQNNPNYDVVAYSRPGLTPWTTVEGAEVRAMYAQNNVLYVVVGDTLYSVTTGGATTSLGTLSTASGICQIKGTAFHIAVNDKTKGYTYTLASDTFAEITDVDFPNGTATIAAQDGYVFAHTGGAFYLSNNNDATTWDTLDFASAEGDPDDIVAIESFQRKLFLIGRVSTEVWFNTGDVDFPFSRIEGVYINYGCEAVDSVAIGDNALYWLARGRDGQLCALSVDESYRDIILSTDALNQEFLTYGTTDDAVGFVYQREGKEFFVLTFPTEKKTWVYDTKLQLWYEYSSSIAGEQDRWLPNSHVAFAGKNLFGDFKSGRIFNMGEDIFTDDTETIVRKIVTSPTMDQSRMVFINRLEVDIESGSGTVSGQGSDPQMMLKVSLDGGFTFNNAMYRTAGKIGEYLPRIYWNRLGSSRRPVFELTMTDPIKWTVLGGWIEVTRGRE
jgi:hypothetical protein